MKFSQVVLQNLLLLYFPMSALSTHVLPRRAPELAQAYHNPPTFNLLYPPGHCHEFSFDFEIIVEELAFLH